MGPSICLPKGKEHCNMLLADIILSGNGENNNRMINWCVSRSIFVWHTASGHNSITKGRKLELADNEFQEKAYRVFWVSYLQIYLLVDIIRYNPIQKREEYTDKEFQGKQQSKAQRLPGVIGQSRHQKVQQHRKKVFFYNNTKKGFHWKNSRNVWNIIVQRSVGERKDKMFSYSAMVLIAEADPFLNKCSHTHPNIPKIFNIEPEYS